MNASHKTDIHSFEGVGRMMSGKKVWQGAFVLIGGAALTVATLAQETPPPAKDAPKTPATEQAAPEAKAPAAETKAEEVKAGDQPATKPEAANTGGSNGEYQTLLDEWKSIIKDLRKIRDAYSTAKMEEAKPLENQWHKLIERGNQLLPNLRRAAEKEFTEGKSNDPQLQRFLVKLAQDAINGDDYENGSQLAHQLLKRFEQDNAPPPQELYYVAGVCDFVVNDYDNAEKYLNLAKDAGTLKDTSKREGPSTTQGEQFLRQLPTYRKYWETEKELREKEAAANDLPRVKLQTTAGTMTLELFENEAPETVGNFISLVESNFYDGLSFHRVLSGFMAQGGDPRGNGTGDAGYKIYCETEKPERRRHFRGSLSMAHAGKDTGSSQFFICFAPQESLDGKHTVFGRVVDGFDVLARIHRVNPEKPADIEPTKIIHAEVLRKRDHKYLPRKVE